MKPAQTMPETPELGLREAAPEVSAEEVAALTTWLRGRGWVKAREIEAALGIDERKLRAMAEHSDGEILSGPGCPGYRRFDRETSLGDADRAASRLESQGRKMLLRAGTIRRRLHRYARG
jgi:hypothetical protein